MNCHAVIPSPETLAAANECRRLGRHEAIKASSARWRAETTPIGVQEQEGGDLELANCNHCASTIARSVVPEEPLDGSS
jgi:hypothetical protein